MKRAILTFIFLICAGTSSAVPVASEDDMRWNRYTSEASNFEILSIDEQTGKYLFENADQLKAWLTHRWTLPNDKFPTKCKIICVPSKETFRDLFGKEGPQCRVTSKEIVIWISSDDARWNTSALAKVMTEVCLQDLENQRKIKLPLSVHRGMAVLNGDLPTIRQNLGNLNLVFQKDLKVYWTKELLNMTPEILASHPPESVAWFDAESAAFMLMLYKEFGAAKFNAFLIQCGNNPEQALQSVYGYKSYADADSYFKRYMYNLSCDITGQGRQVTPNSYLTLRTSR